MAGLDQTLPERILLGQLHGKRSKLFRIRPLNRLYGCGGAGSKQQDYVIFTFAVISPFP